MKKCKECGLEKLLSEFHKNKPSKDGRLSTCRDCKAIYNKKYKEDDPLKRAITL